ncbi:J domain-containing protein [Mycena chlorophos]|uniref:J domain-containing protein n=1 Tax=Mycena chlorophos TaxID=658473 RepID=A0A8H6T632_MYCCL|nr:J domain-containing protein [Mycena chlorophos]
MTPMRRFLSTLASHCASCSRPLVTRLPACTSCGSISPIPNSVPFHDLFSLPTRPNPFIVDQTLLKRRFREAQAVCHPDSWASKGQHNQDVAQGLSSRLNEAYNTLASPLRRAEYILGQHGLGISETDQLEDAELIMEVMETRESIDEAGDPDAVTQIMDENAGKSGCSAFVLLIDAEKIGGIVAEMEGLVGREDWMGLKEAAVRLRYQESIASAGKEKLDKLES